MKWYHASPCHLHYGDVLKGESDPEYKQYKNCPAVVYMTDSPKPHGTVHDRAVAQNWTIYEVKPVGKIRFDRFEGEAQAKEAVVVRRVGHAAGIGKGKKGWSFINVRKPWCAKDHESWGKKDHNEPKQQRLLARLGLIEPQPEVQDVDAVLKAKRSAEIHINYLRSALYFYQSPYRKGNPTKYAARIKQIKQELRDLGETI